MAEPVTTPTAGTTVSSGNGLEAIQQLMQLFGGQTTTTSQNSDTSALQTALQDLLSSGGDNTALLNSIFSQAQAKLPGVQAGNYNATGSRRATGTLAAPIAALQSQTTLAAQQQLAAQTLARQQVQAQLASAISKGNTTTTATAKAPGNSTTAAILKALLGNQQIKASFGTDPIGKGIEKLKGLFDDSAASKAAGTTADTAQPLLNPDSILSGNITNGVGTPQSFDLLNSLGLGSTSAGALQLGTDAGSLSLSDQLSPSATMSAFNNAPALPTNRPDQATSLGYLVAQRNGTVDQYLANASSGTQAYNSAINNFNSYFSNPANYTLNVPDTFSASGVGSALTSPISLQNPGSSSLGLGTLDLGLGSTGSSSSFQLPEIAPISSYEPLDLSSLYQPITLDNPGYSYNLGNQFDLGGGGSFGGFGNNSGGGVGISIGF